MAARQRRSHTIETKRERASEASVDATAAARPGENVDVTDPPDPRFSVIIPVWNGAHWLAGAIASVQAQTSPDWELVIGDNASDEPLDRLVDAADARVRYHRFAEHVGAFENFDRTFDLARGDWVYLLPADDRLMPTCLERIASAVDSHHGARPLAAVITAAARVDPEGRPLEARYYGSEGSARIVAGTYDASGWVHQMVAAGSPPWDCGAFARRIVEQMGVFYRADRDTMSADIELTMRVAAFGDVVYLDEPLIAVTGWEESHTHGRSRRNLEDGSTETTFGMAYLTALAAHERVRTVSDEERSLVHAAVARSHLRRAAAHRYRPGGHGRRAAWADVRSAWQHSPRTVATRLPQVAAVVVAPRSWLAAAREWVLRRRERAASAPPGGACDRRP
jgi:GT2 family glycosyltransferase